MPSIFVAAYLESLDRKKPYILGVGTFQRLPFLVIGILSLFFSISHPKLMIALTLILLFAFYCFGGLGIPSWYDMVAKVTPLKYRGRLFAIRGMGSYIVGILAGLLIKTILDTYPYPLDFTLLFIIGSLIIFLSLVTLAFIKEPVYPIKKEKVKISQHLQGLPKILKTNHQFLRFLIAQSFFIMAISSGTFYSIYTLSRFSLDESFTGTITIISACAYIIANPILGIIGDRIGHRLNFIIGSFSLALASLILLISKNLIIFSGIFVLFSISNGVRLLSPLNMTAEYCKPEDRPSYIALRGLFLTPASILSIGMGLVADNLGYDILFIIALVLSLISTLLFIFWVHEPRKI
jgi:MFS family permease